MAKKTDRKTTTKKKTVRRKSGTSRSASSAARKTTKKKVGRPAASPRTSTKKKKSVTNKKKKTSSRTSAAKKPVRKKTTSASDSATKKRTSTAARAAAARKKSASVKKKTSAKVKSKDKTTTKSKSTAQKTADKSETDSPRSATAAGSRRKSTSKKSTSKSRRRKSLGARSVAEAASEASADADGYVYINGRRVRMISTGGKGVPKRPRVAAQVDETAAQATATDKPIKTKLTAKELRHFRDLLLQKRADLVGDVSAMEEAALNANGGGTSSLPIHMADVGSDTYDQDFILGLAETERSHLREIDDALRRIQDKTYGVCQMTGKPIPKTRLNAKPWAKYTIEAARALEGQWRR